MRILLIVTLGLVYSLRGHSQAVTAPFSVSQRLINPAAATTRAYRTIAAAVERSEEEMKVLNLINSSITEEILVEQLLTHSSWKWSGDWNAELDFALQQGTKIQKNEYTGTFGGQDSKTKDNIYLAPVQLLVATKFTPSFSFGVKTLMTVAKVTTTNSYRTNFNNIQSSVEETNELSSRFLALGFGFTDEFAKNLFISYAADFNQFRADREVVSRYSSIRPDNTTGEETRNLKLSTTRSVRRDIAGLSYLVGDQRRAAFRAEVSGERITPLTKGTDLKDGKLFRATMEGQWLYFHLGGEYIVREGYMVDTYNLIPYFFKFDDFSNQTKTDYGFFGGLRSSRGHSFGAFISVSSSQVREQLSKVDPTLYDVERKAQAYGVSYSYVF